MKRGAHAIAGRFAATATLLFTACAGTEQAGQQACHAHRDCSSALCLPDGSCAAETAVAYADGDNGIHNTTCTKTAPCAQLTAALESHRSYIKVHGFFGETIVLDKGHVAIFGDSSALLAHTTTDPIITVRGSGTSLKLYDLTISGGSIFVPSGSSPSLSLTRVTVATNAGLGITIRGGSFSMRQSTIANNQGGVSITNARFEITNSVFLHNGGETSRHGALEIETTESPLNQLEFNTFAANAAMGLGGAIRCSAGSFTARNNIVAFNGDTGNQVSGSCKHANSLFWPGPAPTGVGNMVSDPMFEDLEKGDLHPRPGSPAIGAAEPSTSAR